jgi:hypothetical protein
VLEACKQTRLKVGVAQHQIDDVNHINPRFARIKASLKNDPVIDVTWLNAQGFAENWDQVLGSQTLVGMLSELKRGEFKRESKFA